jgi:regulator of sirC expression with transglutaminase-like and TPR domain
MEPKAISSQIKLLDDPDETIFRAVRDNLIGFGLEIVPELEKAWESSFSELIQERIEDIIKSIQFTSLKNQLEDWVHTGAKDIAFGAYLLAKYQYPDLSWDGISKQIENIRSEVWLELNENLTALEKVRVLNHILFEVHKFSPNNANFYSPQNAYLNLLFESKKGNPVSLGILYMTIAQHLELPVFGVNLPKNFILCYVDDVSSFHAFGDSADNTVLFYINPFNRGAVFGRKEIDYFLTQQQLEPKKDYFSPCSNPNTLERLISNLILSYEKLGYTDKMSELGELLEILSK